MIAVVQRVTRGKVTVEGHVVGQIERGMVVLVAVERDDTPVDVDWMAAKLPALRIFRNPEDPEKYFDLDVKQMGGAILLVSNFTVAAETRQGRRPSLSGAASPERGRELFDLLVEAVRRTGVPVATGQFRAEMHVEIDNDGPVTFIVKSR